MATTRATAATAGSVNIQVDRSAPKPCRKRTSRLPSPPADEADRPPESLGFAGAHGRRSKRSQASSDRGERRADLDDLVDLLQNLGDRAGYRRLDLEVQFRRSDHDDGITRSDAFAGLLQPFDDDPFGDFGPERRNHQLGCHSLLLSARRGREPGSALIDFCRYRRTDVKTRPRTRRLARQPLTAPRVSPRTM